MGKQKPLKMYIILRWDITPGMAVVSAAHASLGTYLNWQDDPVMQEWQKTSFRKVLCKALHQQHWEWCKERLGEHRVFTESCLNGMEVSLGFRVVKEPTHLFLDLPLWQ
jgi:peptidyl-tRNA hydrolase